VERGTGSLSELPPSYRAAAATAQTLERGLTAPGELPLLPGMRSTELPVDALRSHERRMRRFLLLCLDVLLIVLAFVIAYYLRYEYEFWSEVTFSEPLHKFIPTIGLLVPTTIGLLFFKGLYRLPRNAGWLSQMGIILSSVTTAVTITIVITFLYKPWYYSRLIFALAWVMIIVLLALSRIVLNRWRHWRWSRRRDLERVLVVGGSGLGRQVMANLCSGPSLGYDLVGYLHESATNGQSVESREPAPLLGSLAQLPMVVAEQRVHHVIVALPSWHNRHLPEVVEMCHRVGVPFQIVPDFYELSFDRVTIQELRGVPLIDLRENAIRGWNYALKRAIDVGLVLLTMPLWGTLSLLIMLAIRLDSSGPVIFRQTRIGRNGRPFEFLKFRTMVTDAEQRKAELLEYNERPGVAFKMKNDPRRTRVGSFLRRSSLDEIPQFWNVLRGEMSLVGPRPAIPEEVAQYEVWQRRRLEVMPGCTGLWQVTGRSNTTFEEMVRLDIYYAEHWSLTMDLRILLLTVPAILTARGAY
jgi:exopolysaccharide biosynthesis polyprenyl glycosylphosphotransferase